MPPAIKGKPPCRIGSLKDAKELRADVTTAGLQASDFVQVPDGRVFTQSEFQRELAKHNRMMAAAAKRQAAAEAKAMRQQAAAQKKATAQAIKAQRAALAAHKKAQAAAKREAKRLRR